MSGRAWFACGLMYGFAVGMATSDFLDFCEARARAHRRPTIPARVVTLTGKRPA